MPPYSLHKSVRICFDWLSDFLYEQAVGLDGCSGIFGIARGAFQGCPLGLLQSYYNPYQPVLTLWMDNNLNNKYLVIPSVYWAFKRARAREREPGSAVTSNNRAN